LDPSWTEVGPKWDRSWTQVDPSVTRAVACTSRTCGTPKHIKTCLNFPKTVLLPIWVPSCKFRSLLGPTWVPLGSHFGPTSVPLRSHFGPTSVQLRSHFGPVSVPLRSHLHWYSGVATLTFVFNVFLQGEFQKWLNNCRVATVP
jgi:hypothetical protein